VSVFVDTSAFYAFLAIDDKHHPGAVEAFASIAGERRLTHSYVLVETEALVRARLGVAASNRLHLDLWPAFEVRWVDERLHRSGVAALLAAGRRDLSLVDCVSFELMRVEQVDVALTFDGDFAAAGFQTIPG